MVGRELKDVFPKAKVAIGETLFEVKNFSLKDKFQGINFEVKKGEILGIAGLVGAGRTEVMNSIFGLIPPDTGEIYMEGRRIEIKTPQDAIDNGIAYVTEDRKNEGLILQMGVGQNITLASMKTLSKGLGILLSEEKKIIADQIKALRIKVHSPKQLVASLSGGNQQKVVLAKWMMKNPKLLILDEPTRGIDVGAKSEIYRLMCEYVAKGNAIIMISSEMPEVMGMSDRIIVLSGGRKGGELDRKEFEQERIMGYAVSNI
jgi:ABC-type sugar transport system ATPase subunit